MPFKQVARGRGMGMRALVGVSLGRGFGVFVATILHLGVSYEVLCSPQRLLYRRQESVLVAGRRTHAIS